MPCPCRDEGNALGEDCDHPVPFQIHVSARRAPSATPPKRITSPFGSLAIACPARGDGEVDNVAWVHVVPSHVQVSPRYRLSTAPPKRTTVPVLRS
jgi:hypothetical protein